ncbi:unnamed protein product [Nyctereutes procyonoides]|uniref:(raccoon dog) hypothetical protein n=1 Tax=Nyctereutes procyonoides TaxID=34880 RepID=A0A811ZNK8_NYCPR|nr:unnamed protein product [Nyctereutes procyonoides]
MGKLTPGSPGNSAVRPGDQLLIPRSVFFPVTHNRSGGMCMFRALPGSSVSIILQLSLLTGTCICSQEPTGLEQIILKSIWNQKRPQIAKGLLKKGNRNWWHQNSGLEALLQSCNHQDCMVLTQRQIYRSMEQNREPKNGPSTLWSTNLQQNRKECPMEKRQSLQQMVLGKLDSHMQKNDTGPFPHTTHKNKLKMDERPDCETGIHQNPRGEHRQQPL